MRLRRRPVEVFGGGGFHGDNDNAGAELRDTEVRCVEQPPFSLVAELFKLVLQAFAVILKHGVQKTPDVLDHHGAGAGRGDDLDGIGEKVPLIRRAELRRYRESVVTDELSGAVIVYNNLTDVFTVDGQKKAAASGAGDAPAAGGRVRAVLSPKEQPPGIAAPANAASGPALRPSNSLGGASK